MFNELPKRYLWRISCLNIVRPCDIFTSMCFASYKFTRSVRQFWML